MMNDSNFAKHLKERMEYLNLNQSQLSKFSGICKSGISQYLSGKNIPRKKHQERLSAVLDCSVEYLSSEQDSDDIHQITVKEVAEKLGVLPQCIRERLKNNTYTFGYAFKIKCGKYKYVISSKLFEEYLKKHQNVQK